MKANIKGGKQTKKQPMYIYINIKHATAHISTQHRQINSCAWMEPMRDIYVSYFFWRFLFVIVFGVFCWGEGAFGFLVALIVFLCFFPFLFSPLCLFWVFYSFFFSPLFSLFWVHAQQGGLSPPVAAGHSVTTLSPFTPCVDRAVPAWRGVAPTAMVYV